MSAFEIHMAAAAPGAAPVLVVVPATQPEQAGMLACYFDFATAAWSGERYSSGEWAPVAGSVVEDVLAEIGGMAEVTEVVSAGVQEALEKGLSPARIVEAALAERGVETSAWKEEGRKNRLEKRRAEGFGDVEASQSRKPGELRAAADKPKPQSAVMSAGGVDKDARTAAQSAAARSAFDVQIPSRNNPQR